MMSTLPRTFYRRALPSTATALTSTKGRALFESSMKNKGLKSFFSLIEQFTTQSEPAYCGISTLVIILNALSVDPKQVWKGPWRWYEESMLNCCISLDEVKQTGITMNTFVCLGRCQGLHVEPFLASQVSLEDFRTAVKRACVEQPLGCNNATCPSRAFLVVSYTRKVLQQTGDGHFSPIAAYDDESNQVLILDTARFKYGPHWVPLELLYQAMQPLDKATNKSRGFTLLSFWGNGDKDNQQHALPRTILFETRNLHNPVRRQYKEFLLQYGDSNQEPITWQEALNFWTNNFKDFTLIWQAVQPQRPNGQQEDSSKDNPTQQDQVEEVLSLVRKLLPSLPPPLAQHDISADESSTLNSKCQTHTGEAIFIMYLASLSLENRRNVVYSDSVDATDDTRQQLLAEAELLVYALDASLDVDRVLGCQSCQENRTSN